MWAQAFPRPCQGAFATRTKALSRRSRPAWPYVCRGSNAQGQRPWQFWGGCTSAEAARRSQTGGPIWLATTNGEAGLAEVGSGSLNSQPLRAQDEDCGGCWENPPCGVSA
eukprot:14909349-Alexandrium_andersonii.AAC.1